ncbi:hypothetical protein [Nonomuraea endophytica]|uniref:hypothetical protein n=1 Tax=Nonomuraea endophytica TaxID=714136 RepID=UPI0037CACE66
MGLVDSANFLGGSSEVPALLERLLAGTAAERDAAFDREMNFGPHYELQAEAATL